MSDITRALPPRAATASARWIAAIAWAITVMVACSPPRVLADGAADATMDGATATQAAPATAALVSRDALVEPISEWLSSTDVDAAASAATLEGLNNHFAGGDLDPDMALEVLARAVAAHDARAEELLTWCESNDATATLRDWEWLMDSSTAPLLRNNLRLYLGRWYAQRGLYDESLLLLDQLETESVVAPATLLFFRSVCLHQLVESERARDEINALLTRFHSLPERYDAVATLLQHDLAEAQQGSLDEVARRMRDVRRRLAFNRSGNTVQEAEDRVVSELDRLIEEMEEQQRNQQSSSSSSAGSQQPGGTPAQDSQLLGGNGPGNVAPRNFDDTDNWGNLSAKQREEALQSLSKDLPAHYRSAVEQYFRTLARQASIEESE